MCTSFMRGIWGRSNVHSPKERTVWGGRERRKERERDRRIGNVAAG